MGSSARELDGVDPGASGVADVMNRQNSSLPARPGGRVTRPPNHTTRGSGGSVIGSSIVTDVILMVSRVVSTG
jgi:hypothetical protein